mgnify:CR=1 FL=1
MNIIDAHAHFLDRNNYLQDLRKKMQECNIQQSCISGLGPLFGCVSNEVVKKVIQDYPDEFIGAYFIRPGVNGASDIEQAYADGFKMVKISIPKKPYDSIEYHPSWKTAEELKMPVLFHTGIVTTLKSAKGEGISSWNMHPMRIEPITREFPDLGIIIAHMGVHWNKDAAEVARMRKNVFIDITGEPGGWRERLDKEGIDKYLWWHGAFKKLVFGTDVACEKIHHVISEDTKRLEKYNVDSNTRDLFFNGNIRKLLHLEEN